MSSLLYVELLIFIGLSLGTHQALAAEIGTDIETLCLPGVYQQAPDDCLPLGPSQYLGRMADVGIALPILPLPAQQPDPGLSYLPYFYARVNRETAPLFTSLEAAVNGEPVYRYLETGFDFITYIDWAIVDEKQYYMIAPGVWMQATGLSRVYAPKFQGLEFYTTPKNDFGWVLYPVSANPIPGLQTSEPSGDDFYRYDVVQIYTTATVDGIEWYLVGPDQWVDGRQVARITPNPIAPDGVDNGRWIEINLEQQTLAAYEEDRLVFSTLISSGLPGSWTQPGVFQIYQKKVTEQMSGSFTADRSDYYYLEDVPWTMYFDQARALHGTYWHNGFGVPRSRGCVNLSPGDAQWIFDWIQEGDWVYVWDPSGLTPTDPVLYGSGGA